MPTDPLVEFEASTQALLDEGARLIEECKRVVAERTREYKYRFSQTMVFGLPVVALQLFGRVLGPADWERWVSLLQALLAGWVLYVNLGMFIEGIVALWWRQLSADLLIVALAAGLYFHGALGAIAGIISNELPYPLLFHAMVILLAGWTGWRWWRMARVIS